MAPLERGRLKRLREHLLKEAKGLVLEIGSGTGINFPLYQAAKKVIAAEPSRTMRSKSMKNLRLAKVPIELTEAKAEALPFKDETFDTIVMTLVLCSVDHPLKAINEAKRVLKPGGRILFLEHVRMNARFIGRLQDSLTPVWKHLCDGCHLNRRTLAYLEAAGFEMIDVRRDFHGLFVSGTVAKSAE